MSVIPTDVKGTRGNARWEFETFWQKITRALDRLAVNRSCRTMPATAFHRAKYDLDRCRRLMREG